MASDVRSWFERRLSTHEQPLGDLVGAKHGRTVGVVLPARDEAATVGQIVTAVRTALVDLVPLVDEVVVVDSRSSDGTADVAKAAGADVVTVAANGFDDDGFDAGKGEALRAGTEHLSTDVVVYLDADVRDFDPAYVARLVAPLLRDPELVLVKGFYDRPTGDGGGGRVTELVARPEIARRAPELAGFVQPLAGELAVVREAVLDDPFASGYAVDMALLLHVLRRHSLDAMAQADLGSRRHAHQDLHALGRMALEVRAAFDLVLDGRESVVTERVVPRRRDDGTTSLVTERVETRLLPPLR